MADENVHRLRLGTNSGLPLGYRVLIGVGALLALVAACVLVAVLLLVNLRDDRAQLTERNLPYASAIATAALNAKGMANDERGFLLSGDREFLAEIDDRIVKARQAFTEAEGAAENLEQILAVRNSRAGFERWVEALRNELEMYQAGDTEGAITASLGPVRDLRKQYEASLARADELASEVLESGASSVEAESSRSVTILLVSLLVALVIGFVVAAWLLRTIVKPVHAMLTLYTDALERGNELLGPSSARDRRWAK
jgi:methyl-accepting chemotaxis protein